jgi:cobaltochelatase CobS
MKKDLDKELDKEKEAAGMSFDITHIKAKEGKYTSIPDIKVNVRQTFGLDIDWEVPGFSEDNANVPDIDPTYQFDHNTTLAILAGFAHNRRVMIQGYHGTGKSTHIEQVAARLNWPCVRINLDSHVSRVDLIGKETIVLQEGKQITQWKDGLLPWSIQHPVALVFDEYDAGRPDVMFVIQRVLESEGRLTLLDQNRIIRPHPAFRLFSTANTVGLGDTTGLYHGTQQINQGQMDRWNIVVQLNYLGHDDEMNIMLAKFPQLDNKKGKDDVDRMVRLADLTREGFINGDLSTLMSPRTVLSWIENYMIFQNRELAFQLSFLNRCDETERPIIAEYYQRCFNVDLPESAIKNVAVS